MIYPDIHRIVMYANPIPHGVGFGMEGSIYISFYWEWNESPTSLHKIHVHQPPLHQWWSSIQFTINVLCSELHKMSRTIQKCHV